MAGQFDVHTVTASVNTLGAGGTQPLFYIPDYGGLVTVLGAKITGTTVGTPVGLRLITMSDVGTPALAGTVCKWGGTFTAGTITMGSGIVFDATMVTAQVQPGQWIGIGNVSGTTPAACQVTVSYVTGASS